MAIEADVHSQPEDLAGRFAQALRWYFSAVATELWGNVREEAPVRTGRLAGSWQLRPQGALAWSISTDVDYAAAVQEGTDPHEIVASRAKALRFEMRGKVIYAKRVQHPGTEANPYIDRAIDGVEKRLEDFAAQALNRLG